MFRRGLSSNYNRLGGGEWANSNDRMSSVILDRIPESSSDSSQKLWESLKRSIMTTRNLITVEDQETSRLFLSTVIERGVHCKPSDDYGFCTATPVRNKVNGKFCGFIKQYHLCDIYTFIYIMFFQWWIPTMLAFQVNYQVHGVMLGLKKFSLLRKLLLCFNLLRKSLSHRGSLTL